MKSKEKDLSSWLKEAKKERVTIEEYIEQNLNSSTNEILYLKCDELYQFSRGATKKVIRSMGYNWNPFIQLWIHESYGMDFLGACNYGWKVFSECNYDINTYVWLLDTYVKKYRALFNFIRLYHENIILYPPKEQECRDLIDLIKDIRGLDEFFILDDKRQFIRKK